MARKAIGKTQRFEIFKRDGFVCAYCGAHPPEVVLEVDHIIAAANGGADDSDNLVTACFNCNRGKAARDLKVVPMSLADKAAMVAEQEAQLAGYTEIMMAKRLRIEDETWIVVRALDGQDEKYARDKLQSIKLFLGKLPLHEVLEAAEIARAAKPYSTFQAWKYFCGVCWTKIKRQGDGNGA